MDLFTSFGIINSLINVLLRFTVIATDARNIMNDINRLINCNSAGRFDLDRTVAVRLS